MLTLSLAQSSHGRVPQRRRISGFDLSRIHCPAQSVSLSDCISSIANIGGGAFTKNRAEHTGIAENGDRRIHSVAAGMEVLECEFI